jgi:signal peptidase II
VSTTLNQFAAVLVFVLAADQLSKAAVVRFESRGDCLLAGCGFKPRRNRRPGMLRLRAGIGARLWVASFLAALVVLLLRPRTDGLLPVALGLALGGALGNLVDLLMRGCVIDFIALARWPTFNLADAGMVIGAVLCAAALLAR